jgi:hypothetical protein
MASIGQSTRVTNKDLPDPCDEKRELRRMVQELEAENERLRDALQTAGQYASIGVQKSLPDPNDGFRRIRDHVFGALDSVGDKS